MIHTGIEIIVMLQGGIWKIKERINCTSRGIYRNAILIIYYLYLRNCGSYIGHSAIFGGVPLFPHGIKGIFIAGGSKIGRNCIIFHHVTIGANPLPYSKTTGFPTIGECCYIGAGATIIGDIKIGNNCRIGANCTVFTDIPDNSLVVAQEPRIISKNRIDNRYYKWSKEGPVYFSNGQWHLETDCEIIKRLSNKL